MTKNCLNLLQKSLALSTTIGSRQTALDIAGARKDILSLFLEAIQLVK